MSFPAKSQSEILGQGRLANRPGVLLLHLRHLPFRVEDAQAGHGGLPQMQACAHQGDLILDETGTDPSAEPGLR